MQLAKSLAVQLSVGLGFLAYTRLSPIVLSSRSLGRTAGNRRHCPHNKGGLAFQSSMATVRGKGWQNDSTGFTFHCKRFEYKAQLWKFSLEKVQCSVWAKRGSEKRENSAQNSHLKQTAGSSGRETGKWGRGGDYSWPTSAKSTSQSDLIPVLHKRAASVPPLTVTQIYWVPYFSTCKFFGLYSEF